MISREILSSRLSLSSEGIVDMKFIPSRFLASLIRVERTTSLSVPDRFIDLPVLPLNQPDFIPESLVTSRTTGQAVLKQGFPIGKTDGADDIVLVSIFFIRDINRRFICRKIRGSQKR